MPVWNVFNFKNKVNVCYTTAAGCSIFFWAWVLIALSTPWYYVYEQNGGAYQPGVASVTNLEYLTWRDIVADEDENKCYYTDDDECLGVFYFPASQSIQRNIHGNLHAMYSAIFSFTIMNFFLIMTLPALLLLISFWFTKKLGALRYGIWGCSLVMVVVISAFCVIGWTVLFRHPSAIEDGMPLDCADLTDETVPMCKFAADSTVNGNDWHWGPHSGWYFTLVMSFFIWGIAICIIAGGAPPNGEEDGD